MDSTLAQTPSQQAMPEAHQGPKTLGRGRSGVVYLTVDAGGRKLARKVFDSHGLTKLVQCVFLGSPNPYIWNQDAVRCAVLRRRILSELVKFWFGARLRVADARGSGWNTEHRALELHSDFTPGKPVPLHHPLRTRGSGLLHELTRNVMKPLQKHLIEAGFDGLVWQAGKGNPVALNNFLYEQEAGPGAGRWVWIDLESGVPALFPLNPVELFRFYLPRCVRFRRPLFDDVDSRRLQTFLERNAGALEESLGAQRLLRLRRAAAVLDRRQARWKSLRLYERGIGYRLARGEISEEQAARYRRSRVLWYAREAWRATRGGLRRIARLPLAVAAGLARIPWARIPAMCGRLLVSQRYRERIARHYVAHSIRAWRRRGQLEHAEARHLRSRLASEESSSYLSDFGVHVAIKPFVKAIEWWVLPVLFGFGLISGATWLVGVTIGGPLARTLYTGVRFAQATLARREKPWVALGVGVFPIVGNFAYPLQIVYSSTEAEDDLARFILYDGGARVGRLLPIWGGQDTWTEHYFNRLPDFFANLRRKRVVLPDRSDVPGR